MHKKEKSYGIIPIRKQRGKWELLLVKHGKEGHWAFPKGHPEKGETPKQTAVREFNEETGLHIISFLNISPQKERYFFGTDSDLIEKTVVYFAAIVSGKITLQETEISDFKWLTVEAAQDFATYPGTKALCVKISFAFRNIS